MGVKKLLLAAIVPCCPENHYNKKILNSMGVEGLEWGTTVDLKMAMYVWLASLEGSLSMDVLTVIC